MASLRTTSLWARSWSPWAVGLALGLLSWFAFATADHAAITAKLTMPTMTGTSPWLWIAGLAIAVCGAWLLSRRRATRSQRGRHREGEILPAE